MPPHVLGPILVVGIGLGTLSSTQGCAEEECPPPLIPQCGLVCASAGLEEGNGSITHLNWVDPFFRASIDARRATDTTLNQAQLELDTLAALVGGEPGLESSALQQALAEFVSTRLDGSFAVWSGQAHCVSPTLTALRIAQSCQVAPLLAANPGPTLPGFELPGHGLPSLPEPSITCAGTCSSAPGSGCGPGASLSCGGPSSECEGTCEGPCNLSLENSCLGICRGTCTGTCSIEATDGSCKGTCNGSCLGTCVSPQGAECSGACVGTCITTGADACDEAHEGTCTAESPVPCSEVCDGTIEVPGTDPTCSTAARVTAVVRGRCDPPEVHLAHLLVGAPLSAPWGEGTLGEALEGMHRIWAQLLAHKARLQELRKQHDLLAESASNSVKVQLEKAAENTDLSIADAIGFACGLDELPPLVSLAEEAAADSLAMESRIDALLSPYTPEETE